MVIRVFEAYIIRNAQAGDKQALDNLVRRYYDKIYSYCYHHVQDEQMAEDICQETFYRALSNIEKYKHYDKFQNYLYVIAGNQCKDYYKKKKPIYMADVPINESSIESFEEVVTMKELVQRLPIELKEVVVLRYYQDLKYQDIAKIIHCSASLVKYRVQKALDLLREEFERSR